MLGGLSGNTAEVRGGYVKSNRIIKLRIRLVLASHRYRHFVKFVHVVIISHHSKKGVDDRIALARIHLGLKFLDGISAGNHLPVSRDEGKLKGCKDLLAVNALFFFVIVNECDDVVGHGLECVVGYFRMNGDDSESDMLNSCGT